jgi:hypothetical protein
MAERIKTRVLIKVETTVDGTVYSHTYQISDIPSFKSGIARYGENKLAGQLMKGFVHAYAQVETRAISHWLRLGRRPARPSGDAGRDGERPAEV